MHFKKLYFKKKKVCFKKNQHGKIYFKNKFSKKNTEKIPHTLDFFLFVYFLKSTIGFVMHSLSPNYTYTENSTTKRLMEMPAATKLDPFSKSSSLSLDSSISTQPQMLAEEKPF